MMVPSLKNHSKFFMAFPVETVDEKGEKVAFNQFSTFVVGAGNFGGPKTSSESTPLVDTPSRAPDASMEERTSVDQVSNVYQQDQMKLYVDNIFSFVL